MNLKDALRQFVAAAPRVRVLVVGDCMLDTYISGSASRISPEAPVPVVSVGASRNVPGGAANVAANCRAMGASVKLVGIVGADRNAESLRNKLQEMDALICDPSRRTTTKTRVTAAGQQIVRFDEEDTGPLGPAVATQVTDACVAQARQAQVCIISDYAKGVVTAELCRRIVDTGIPIVVDPKARDLSIYSGATVITPNLKEAVLAAGDDGAPLQQLAQSLLTRIAPSALLITRGEEGMSLFEASAAETHLPAVVNEVADVTGAGDTVVSALAIALGCGFSLPDAARIANIAAGIAVSHSGTWAVRAEEILASAHAQ